MDDNNSNGNAHHNDIGLRCPICGCAHFYTTHTERIANKIRRRKVCRHCGHKVVTYEVTASELRRRDC